jgi:tetratricopeptide (TPR) repeat protein
MLRDDKNDGFYDQIWYELGNLEMKEKNIPAAIRAYKMAAGQQGKNPNQKALAYLALGNIYLDLPDYKLAQAYYDSTASSISPNYKDYQKIMDKKMVLSDLISNLIVIETQDSLLTLSTLSQPQIEQKIDQWIAAAKADSVLTAKRKKDRKEQEAMAKLNPQQNLANTNTSGFGEQGQWYFYNPTVMASGAAEFFSQRKWGQRANEDYWRIAAKEKEKTNQDGESGEEGGNETVGSDSSGATGNAKDTVEEKPAPSISGDRQAWIKDVPFSNDAKGKANALMVTAFYNIGIIYDEKLSDAKEAIKDYELLLNRFPKNEYEPEVMYKLFKLYTAQKETAKAEAIRNRLIAEYPNSNYALIVQNKSITSAETDANREVVVFYEQTYSWYSEGNYAEVKRRKMEALKKFPGNSLQPKFDLLYALAVGRTDSLEIFKRELTELVKLYPKTDVSDRAQAILDYMKKQAEVTVPDSLKPKEPDFIIDPTQGPFYVILAIKDDKLDMNELIGRLTTYNEEYNQFDNLRNNTMLSNEGYQLLMVREFKEMEKAIAYHSDLLARDAIKKRLKYEGNYIAFVVSSANFKKMLKEQKIDIYNKLYSEYLNSKPKKQ